MNSLFSSFNKRNLFLLLITAAVIHAGCKKDSQGTPSIKAVRLDDSTHRDSTFSKAFPGTLVVIEGSGFTGATNVYFNDVDAPLNVALMSDKNIIIRIPANAPTKATDPNVTSMLKVVTTHGTASYAFELLAPAPVITSVSNENALVGETITLKGSNFYLVSQVTFPGNIAVTQFTASPDGTQIVVTVPTGITTGAPLQVVAQFGTGSSLFAFDNFNSPGPGFLANFENGDSHMGWQYWGGNQTNDATRFPNNTGYYIEIHPSSAINAGDGSWYSDNRAVMVNSSSWVANMSDPIANYALKFEMYVLSSWTSGSLMITTSAQINPPSNTSWSYLARYAPWQSASSGDAKTSGWVTVSIPLTAFLSTNKGSYNASGTTAANFTALMGGTSSVIQIMLYNDGTTTLPAFDAAFDNVRVEKLQ